MDEVLELAIEAFWEVVARHHPEISTRDLGSAQSLSFENACRTAYDAWLKGSFEYTLGGGRIELEEFIRLNGDNLTPEQITEIRALKPGQEMMFGDGVWAAFTLRRRR